MAENFSLVQLEKRSSLQPINTYDDRSISSQMFIHKPSRPSIETNNEFNFPLMGKVRCHSPKYTDWSDHLLPKKRIRMSDLPTITSTTFLPSYDKTENFSQLWAPNIQASSENLITNIGVIINQDNSSEGPDTPLFFRPYNDLKTKTSRSAKNSFQSVFLGPPHIKTNRHNSMPETRRASLQYVDNSEFKYESLYSISNLESLILKVFYKEKISTEDLVLNPRDSMILCVLLQRKFKKSLEPEDFKSDKDKLVDVINNLINFSSSKRPEECHKLILSKAFKHLRKTSRHQSEDSDDNSAEFYNYYFRGTADTLGLKPNDFQFPSKSKVILSSNSLNTEYFSKIFASKTFVKDLEAYMATSLKDEHRCEIKKKIIKMIHRWEELFLKSRDSPERVLAFIKNDIVKNKKFKLPWTFLELLQAVFRVNELIEAYGSK